MLTTMSYSPAVLSTACAHRSVPFGISSSVMTTSPPALTIASRIRSSSVATTKASNCVAFLACKYVRTIMGFPAIITKGFPGNRVDAYRAGMTPMTFVRFFPFSFFAGAASSPSVVNDRRRFRFKAKKYPRWRRTRTRPPISLAYFDDDDSIRQRGEFKVAWRINYTPRCAPIEERQKFCCRAFGAGRVSFPRNKTHAKPKNVKKKKPVGIEENITSTTWRRTRTRPPIGQF